MSPLGEEENQHTLVGIGNYYKEFINNQMEGKQPHKKAKRAQV